MDPNLFCEEECCIAPALHFYFKSNKQRKVCALHQPSHEEKLYPIDQIYFTTSPEDETEFLKRLEESRKGREYLRQVKVKVDEELKAAEEALDTAKTQAMKIITQVYEAEKRRTQQHSHQVNVILDDFTRELTFYQAAKENQLSALMRIMLNEEKPPPALLRFRVFNNDLELARIIKISCNRGELQLDRHLSAFLKPLTHDLIATQLFQQAQKAANTDDFIGLQKALADCVEALTLRERDEAVQLKTYLEEKIENLKRQRETELTRILTQDAISTKSLLDYCLSNVEIQKQAGNSQEVEKLYMKTRQLLLPFSQSIEAADALRRAGVWFSVKDESRHIVAQEYLLDSLRIYSTYFPNSIGRGNSLLGLGSLFHVMQMYPEAVKHYEEALMIFSVYFPASLNRATTLHSLGELYQRSHRNVEAEQSYQSALDIFKPNSPTSIETAKTLLFLGVLYHDTNRYQEAETALKESLVIYEGHFPNEIDTAKTEQRLGLVYIDMNQFEAAEKSFEAALRRFRLNFPTSIDTSTTLYNLGFLYKCMNRSSAAELYMSQAIAILRQHYPTSMETALAFFNLGKLYNELGRDLEAEQNYQEALNILIPNFPSVALTADAYDHLGSLYCKLSRYPEAEESYEKAAEILRTHYRNSPETAKTLQNQASLYLKLQKYPEAVDRFEEALQIYSGSSHLDALRICNTLATLCSYPMKSYPETIRYCTAAMQVLKINFPVSIETAKALLTLGTMYLNVKELAKAEECLKEALLISEANQSVSFSNGVRKTLMQVYEMTGDIQKMEELFAIRN